MGFWGYLGVDNLRSLVYARKDNKVLVHLNDHKYRSSQILKRHKYQVSGTFNHSIIHHRL